MTDTNGNLVVKWVHVLTIIVSTLTIWLLTAGMLYGVMRTHIEDLQRRTQDLENQHFIPGSQGVSKDQFLEFEKHIMDRLDRIDRKLDKR